MQLKIFIFIFIIFGVFINVNAQTELEVANQRLDKTLDLLENSELKRQNLESQIQVLNLKVEKLEQLQDTPCSTAIKSSTADLTYWHNLYNNANDFNRKELQKTLKERRKYNSKILSTQCGFDNKSGLQKFTSAVKDYSPLLALLLLF